MSIANLRLDESAKLEFDVLITGADGVPTSRFVIEGKDYSISFPCRQVNEGVEVDVSGLKNVLPAGEYPVRLEVVLENKIYVPMQDTIKLEPIVEINTKSKPSTQIKESVKILGKVNVTKKSVVSEETQRQIQAATDVLAYLKVSPSLEASPSAMINEALQAFESLSRSDLIALEKLLLVAESRGVAYDKSLVPSLHEAKKMEDDDEEEDDDEDDVKEDKDTSDYKLSASGKKVKAHKIVFNKGDEEPHISEEKLEEVLSASDPIDKWISDFVHSKDKRFDGKSKDERIKMAKGAYYAAQRNEELELDAYMISESGLEEDELFAIAEKYMGFTALSAALKAKGAKNPEALAAWIGRKKHGKEQFQKAAASGKKMNESTLAKSLVRKLLSK